MTLAVRPREECRFDLVSLGEVMLRLDPGEGRVRTTRSIFVRRISFRRTRVTTPNRP